MNSNKFSYQGQIETILHYLNSMIQKNWTGKTADEFNRLMSIPELAKIACMSARNLQLMFKAYTSETIHQYIIRTRMEYAQQLLKDNKKSIAEIYEYIGFANQSALNNTLQKKYNLTPRELQKKLLETRVRDNILKSKEKKNIQPTKGGHKMVTCQNYVSLFYRQITSCPSDGGIS